MNWHNYVFWAMLAFFMCPLPFNENQIAKCWLLGFAILFLAWYTIPKLLLVR